MLLRIVSGCLPAEHGSMFRNKKKKILTPVGNTCMCLSKCVSKPSHQPRSREIFLLACVRLELDGGFTTLYLHASPWDALGIPFSTSLFLSRCDIFSVPWLCFVLVPGPVRCTAFVCLYVIDGARFCAGLKMVGLESFSTRTIYSLDLILNRMHTLAAVFC